MGQTNEDVDPNPGHGQKPEDALGNTNNVWEEEAEPNPNLFSED